jgi:hypothetical protein
MNRYRPIFAPPSLAYPTRRNFLTRAGSGIGLLALTGLLERDGLLAATEETPSRTDKTLDLTPRPPHFGGQAKSVIWLFMHGAPSQMDTWDYKPALETHDGQKLEGFDQSTGFFAGSGGPIMKSPFKFARHGQSGKWVSEIFPHLSRHVDDLAFIHSCFAHENNHSPAQFEMNTGMSRMGFPCVGSWVTYGLGTVNQNLPGFVVMYDTQGRGLPKSRSQSWGSGFLPGIFQGTPINASGAPIANLERSAEISNERQLAQLDFLRSSNRRHLTRNPAEAELEARIESFELAYRMQLEAPEALDIEAEPESVRTLYGIDNPRCSHFGKQALMARRLVERGTRFVQIYSGGTANHECWDGHDDIEKNHRQFAGETDLPIAGLLDDLKRRGMLESTLVVCCGEFGRLPLIQTGGTGRDHNPHAFTVWMAGAGIKAGARYGKTDELGHKAVEDRVSINDLHATILHLVGLDHEKLTYRWSGRDFRLTDVAGKVVHEILA